MFERFTDRARRAIVLAQEEARGLGHDYIGTEHLILGLAAEEGGVGRRALDSLGISLADLRDDVLRIIGRSEPSVPSHIPFTPRAKQCLELCLREALMMGHNYIGTEHILLGVVREGQGVAAQILVARGLNLGDVRERVMVLLASSAATAGGETVAVTAPFQPRVTAEALAEEGTYDPKCPNCRRASLIDTAAYKTIDVPEDGGEGRLRLRVVYCEACGVAITTLIVPDGE